MNHEDLKGFKWFFKIILKARGPVPGDPQTREEFTYEGNLLGAKRYANKMFKERYMTDPQARLGGYVTAYVIYQNVVISSKVYGEVTEHEPGNYGIIEAKWFDNAMKHRFGF